MVTNILDDKAINIFIEKQESVMYILYVLGLAVFSIVLLVSSFELTPEAARIPRLFAILALITTIIEGVRLIRSYYFDDTTDEDGEDITTDDFDEISEQLRSRDHSSRIQLTKLSVQIGWILLYVLMIYMIGFFTGNFVYIILYIVANSSEVTSIKDMYIPFAWSVFVTSFLWILFVELLGTGAMFRLGVMI